MQHTFDLCFNDLFIIEGFNDRQGSLSKSNLSICLNKKVYVYLPYK